MTPTPPAGAEPSPTPIMSNTKKIVPCVCGHPDTPNVIHRFDGPCYQQTAPLPEETAAREFSRIVLGLSNDSEKKLAAIIARHFAPLRAELAEYKRKEGEAMFSSDPNKATVPLIKLLDAEAELAAAKERIANQELSLLALSVPTWEAEERAELLAELERVKGELKIQDDANDILTRDLTAARARIGELEKALELGQANCDDVYNDLKRERDVAKSKQIIAERNLALANAKYEEARRAGVKCFDESHPDDLGQRIHAIMEAHEKEHRHHIYRRSLLEKALFEMLNQPIK